MHKYQQVNLYGNKEELATLRSDDALTRNEVGFTILFHIG